ncbi:MAG: hypothetical protein ABIH34_07315 [Nanoarchaeota archaeon]
MKKSSFAKVFFGGIFGIIFFLILLAVLNIVSFGVGDPVFLSVVGFLNQNLLVILLISLLIFLANIFELFIFPFNLLYPFFNAIGGVLWVIFIFRVLILIDFFSGEKIYDLFIPLYSLAITLVPLIILIIGLIRVFTKLMPRGEPMKKAKKTDLEWSDVGEEFKEALYNLGGTLKEAFAPKPKAKKKQK